MTTLPPSRGALLYADRASNHAMKSFIKAQLGSETEKISWQLSQRWWFQIRAQFLHINDALLPDALISRDNWNVFWKDEWKYFQTQNKPDEIAIPLDFEPMIIGMDFGKEQSYQHFGHAMIKSAGEVAMSMLKPSKEQVAIERLLKELEEAAQTIRIFIKPANKFAHERILKYEETIAAVKKELKL